MIQIYKLPTYMRAAEDSDNIYIWFKKYFRCSVKMSQQTIRYKDRIKCTQFKSLQRRCMANFHSICLYQSCSDHFKTINPTLHILRKKSESKFYYDYSVTLVYQQSVLHCRVSGRGAQAVELPNYSKRGARGLEDKFCGSSFE